MTRSDDTLSDRSQNPVPVGVDMVTVDRKTLKRILALLVRCSDDVTGATHCEVMLIALDNYITEEKTFKADKAILFLRYWLHVVPELLKGTLNSLEEAYTILRTILEATR
jgi:hypothetical protein